MSAPGTKGRPLYIGTYTKIAHAANKGAMTFKASKIMTNNPIFFPNTLPTFVPPEFPEPKSRGSLWKKIFPIQIPFGIDPKK